MIAIKRGALLECYMLLFVECLTSAICNGCLYVRVLHALCYKCTTAIMLAPHSAQTYKRLQQLHGILHILDAAAVVTLFVMSQPLLTLQPLPPPPLLMLLPSRFIYPCSQPQHFDDRVGPLGLCAAVVTALVAILIVSFIDFIDFLEASKPSPDPSPAPQPSPALLMPNPAGGVQRLVELAAGLTKPPGVQAS
jgi:hypothetical protein